MASRVGSINLLSDACPSESTNDRGRALPSAHRWILVVSPPRLRPSASEAGLVSCWEPSSSVGGSEETPLFRPPAWGHRLEHDGMRHRHPLWPGCGGPPPRADGL